MHAITLSEAPMTVTGSEAAARVFADGMAALGLDRLPWSNALQQWRGRVMFLRGSDAEAWPDLSDQALIDSRDTEPIDGSASPRKPSERMS